MNSRLKGRFIHNLSFAFTAQLVSLCVSILLSLFAPKILGIKEYSYWQLFIFYTNYVNLAQFGIVDGIYLRTGGKEYKNLDFPLIKTEYLYFGLLQLIAFAIVIIFSLFTKDQDKSIVFICVGIYLVIYNMSRFLGYIFQAVNETKLFSISSIIDRIIILIFGILIILLHVITWRKMIVLFISGITVSLFFSWYCGKEILLSKRLYDNDTVKKEMIENASVGSKLMLSNLASTLILGCGRQAIEWKWGIESFGKISFSLSITSFFLMFINQVSLVLFPALRKINFEKSKIVFNNIEKTYTLLSPIIYIIYLPASYLLSIWLPHYSESLKMLMFLMPLCIFDGKMQMLYNTYFKVYRKEKILLNINIFCVVLSLFISVIFTIIIPNLYIILIGMVLIIIIRSVISKIVLKKIMAVEKNKYVFIDLFFAALSIIVNILFDPLYAEIAIIISYFLFIVCFVSMHKNMEA